jgi:pimeloyl-ACP methyl ester carboxylesterase
MPEPQFLQTKEGRQIAYHQTAGQGLGVVFLGGLRSDMGGSKAIYLEDWAQETGRAFLRFDYSGHGQSSGRFENGAIGDWLEDAEAALALTVGPQILIGSSMGGWIALLLAQKMADRVAGLVGVAAAPDFTEDGIWAELNVEQQNELREAGQIVLPSDYSDSPTIITRRMIEDGRRHLVLRTPLALPFPTRLLQGTNDVDVHPSVALSLLNHATGDDIRLTLVKDADHRFSTPSCLALIKAAVLDILAQRGSDA